MVNGSTMPLISIRCLLCICAALLACMPLAELHAEESAKPQQKTATLPGIEGKTVEVPLDAPGKVTVLCFLGSECPLARLYGPRLEQMAQEFGDKVQFIGLNSNLHDSLEDVTSYAKTHKLTFPFAKDYDNRIADHFEAERTPEVVVLDAKGTIRYRGRIDDQYLPGIVKPAPSRDDLKLALQELLANKEVSVAETEPVGCLIGKVYAEEITTDLTYCRDVAPVLQKHCVECHRPGDIGPFALTDFDEVVGWGDMMLEVVDQGRMPPWHANPEFNHFANERRMSDKEKALLHEWVNGGMPFGNAEDLPEPETYVEGWSLPKQPDIVLDMSRKAFDVPNEGFVDYQYYVVDPQFEEDKWITAAQVLPGNRAVVHHCIVFVRPPDGEKFRGLGWIAAYVPGQRSVAMPEGYARRVPAGSQLVFQMHYTPNGIAQSDLTKIGLIFEEEKNVTHEVATLVAINSEFEIPPHAADHPVSGSLGQLPRQGHILAIAPHMHYRGKSCRVFAHEGDEKTVMLDVPAYDFNWQHVYELATPRPLKGIEKLSFVCKYDNSENNPFNPNPNDFVTWGDQSSEEMAIAFFEVAFERGAKADPEPTKTPKKIDLAREQRVKDFVDDFFKRFDKDSDGLVKRDELPTSMQRFAFKNFDRDNNSHLDREEIQRLANASAAL